jgi:hypothetical protein
MRFSGTCFSFNSGDEHRSAIHKAMEVWEVSISINAGLHWQGAAIS